MSLLRNRRFQALWIGGAISQLGTDMTRIAMPMLVLALTGSPGLAGVVAGAKAAAMVVAQLPAGVWVDRWDRRRTLLGAQAVQVLAAAVLAGAVLAGQAQVWVLVALAAVDGVCVAFTGPALDTAIRGVVPPEQMRAAYAQEESRRHAAALAGPPVGGFLYGLGQAVPFLADAVSYLLALVATVFARVPRRPAGEARPVRTGMRGEVGQAVGWLWRRRGLREVCLIAMMLNLLGGAFVIPLVVLVGERGGDALDTGAVFAAMGAGGLAGALLSGWLGRLLPPGRLAIAFTTVFGGAIMAMALPFGPWWPMVPLLVFSLTTPTFNVVVSAVISRLVPDDMLGRAGAVLTLASRGLTPLAPVLGGSLAAAFGGAWALAVIGALMLVVAGVAAASQDVRSFTDEPDEVAA
ncbi:MFS transporter [Nonomuraea sp. NPDC050790]|uniref:MFS transporter n=1 Tax=Nonomuraea sp. NPDC050790 TaxID=3364371 RepID=UPI0037943A89